MEDFHHTVERGEGAPLIFLHGWSTNGRFFSPQLELGAMGRRVIVPDLPGHGHDRRASAPISIADMAEALDRFLVRRHLKDVVLVGWSMGATVAFDYIARHGAARLSALVVIDMSPRIVNDETWTLGITGGFNLTLAEAEAAVMARDWPRYAGRIVRNLFAPGLGPDHPLHRFAAAEIAANDGMTLASVWRSLAHADHRTTLEHITLRSLVIAGAESRIYRPEVTKWLAQKLPHAIHEAVPAAGHTPQLEQPARFNAVLARFLASLGR